MKYIIEKLSKTKIEEYDSFLLKSNQSLFYTSTSYKYLIEKNLKCKSIYFIALKNNDIVGAFPLMIHYDSEHGNVANSLPFYGSNGGIIVSPELSKNEKDNLRRLLLQTTLDYIAEENCVASTFITNPLDDEQNEWFKNNVEYDYLDKRIGQITELPEYNNDLENTLLKRFESPRPRNIRKAIKSGVRSYISNKSEDFEFLYFVHKENIESIGGLYKNEDFFLSIPIIIDPENYKLYIAEIDGEKIAALLLFYFNKTVEYYTPATIVDYRNLQPTSLLIFEAMKDAIKNGFKYWNWGGTWLTQSGVYNFKKKWGSEDFPYYYYTNIYDKCIVELTKDELLKQYPNFFVVPFKFIK